MIPSLRNANDRLAAIAGSVRPSGSASTVAIASLASEKQVIGLSGFLIGLRGWRHRSGGKAGFGPILNDPAALLEEEINLLPCLCSGVISGGDGQVHIRTDSLETVRIGV
jgi:hypothetical protein